MAVLAVPLVCLKISGGTTKMVSIKSVVIDMVLDGKTTRVLANKARTTRVLANKARPTRVLTSKARTIRVLVNTRLSIHSLAKYIFYMM